MDIPLQEIDWVGPERADKLAERGLVSLSDVGPSTVEDVEEVCGPRLAKEIFKYKIRFEV